MCRPKKEPLQWRAGRMFLWIRTNPLPSLQRWKAQCVMVRQAPISYGMTYGDLMVLRQPISLVSDISGNIWYPLQLSLAPSGPVGLVLRAARTTQRLSTRGPDRTRLLSRRDGRATSDWGKGRWFVGRFMANCGATRHHRISSKECIWVELDLMIMIMSYHVHLLSWEPNLLKGISSYRWYRCLVSPFMRTASLIQGNKALLAQKQNWNAAAFLLSSFPEVQLQAGRFPQELHSGYA